jgi:hypothetical protein
MHGDGESPRAVVAGNGKSEDEKRREQCFLFFVLPHTEPVVN